MKTYEIMQKARKYVIGAVVAGSLGYGAMASPVIAQILPLREEVKQELVAKDVAYKAQVQKTEERRVQLAYNSLDSLVTVCRESVKSAEDDFNNALNDQVLTVKEQDKVKDKLNYASKTLDKVVKMSEKVPGYHVSYQIPVADKNLYELLSHGDLQKALSKNGVNVKVEPDYFCRALAFFGGVLSAAVLLKAFGKRR